MSISDKIANEDADSAGSLWEFDLSAMHVRDILDREPVRGYYFPRSPADWLAHVLINLRRAATGSESERNAAVRSMSEMIELCFLRSPTYYAVLELYTMEHLGESRRAVWEVVASEIKSSMGKPLTYPGWTPGNKSATGSEIATAQEASEGKPSSEPLDPPRVRLMRFALSVLPDECVAPVLSVAELFALDGSDHPNVETAKRLLQFQIDDPRWADLGRLVEGESDDWLSRFRAFARALEGVLGDERTPKSVSDVLSAVLEDAAIRDMVSHFAPESEKSDG